MSYTNLPPPESGLPWRVGVHRLAYEDGRFRLNPTSGRVVGPDGFQDKDAVIFNLRDGRVGLIHRIHPNIQLALFDSLDDLWDQRPSTGTSTCAASGSTRSSSPRKARSASAPALRRSQPKTVRCSSSTSERATHYTTKVALLDDDTGRVRSLLPDPIMRPELPWECVGTSTTSSSSRAPYRGPTARST